MGLMHAPPTAALAESPVTAAPGQRERLGADLITLGLTLGLVFSPELQKQPEYHGARARLEKYFGGKEIDPESAI